ncbi:uncharacterized protein LOC122672410 [Telopea speciosissima]|uniref:uncharacterized protein LOC122672410 n=1 Tax=Telopea speciosissima TaxID=54955 RepID=UPI001CC7CC61|nr:uncharacterized protein LOC122672410 [Telopea speciosissima]
MKKKRREGKKEKNMRTTHAERVTTHAAWFPSLPGAYKLNCDASFDPGSKSSGVGFLVRDHLDKSFIAISNPVTSNDILIGEALAIREGLLEAISEGTLSITVESDNLGIISCLMYPSKAPDLKILPIVEDIRHISSYLDDCNFSYIPRTANSVVDCLARRALSVSGRMVWPNSDPLLSGDIASDTRSVSCSSQ